MAPYGTSKLCAEQYLGLYERLHGMSTVVMTANGVVRYSNALKTPRNGPSPSTGSATSRSNSSHPAGELRDGAVTSIVGPGHRNRSTRY